MDDSPPNIFFSPILKIPPDHLERTHKAAAIFTASKSMIINGLNFYIVALD